MRRLFLFTSFCLLSSLILAQSVRVDFNDGEFFLAEEDYEEALYAFGKVYNKGYQDNAYINYRMGLCLINIPGRKTESIPYLEKAEESISTNAKEGKFGEKSAPPVAILYLGNAYRINMEIDKAIEKYNAFAKYIDPKDKTLQAYVDQQIVSCGNALVGTTSPVDYKIGNLGQLQETHTSRYNMMVSGDLQTMAFMGKNPFYSGVYVAVKKGDVWGKPMNITPSIASDGNMDVVGLSNDGKEMLLAVTDQFTSNIYISVYENKRWNPAVSVGKPVNSKYYEANATLSPDGKSIYFSSNRKKSIGGMDIFRSDMLDNGTWGEPVNLGPAINTMLNEDVPVMSPDGKRLYFSSQGHSTMGGFDVFYSELLEDGSWHNVPVNLGYPLNTSDDDYTFSPMGLEEKNSSYIFTQGKMLEYDLFKYEMIGRNETPVPVSMDKEEEVVEEAVVEETPEPEPEQKAPPEKYYLRPIYFGFDSDVLSREGISKLDILTSILEKHPTLQLEITGHTDAKGTFDYNQRLSVDRAKSVYMYLILNGISNDRMIATGMSESEHVARNTTRDERDAPDGRMLNRRVEFKVGILEDVIIEMEKVEVPDHLKLDE
ncbi:MAG: PD40 domain-containing protein [Bacteroidales bacterium]|nr:PD40 domain-containing protein [Bacteroidales bacterium]